MVKGELSPQSIFERDALEKIFEENGVKTRHVRSIWKYLFNKDAKAAPFDLDGSNQIDYTQIPELPKKAAELLKGKFVLTTSTLLESSMADHDPREGTAATDGGRSSKLVVRLQGGR